MIQAITIGKRILVYMNSGKAGTNVIQFKK